MRHEAIILSSDFNQLSTAFSAFLNDASRCRKLWSSAKQRKTQPQPMFHLKCPFPDDATIVLHHCIDGSITSAETEIRNATPRHSRDLTPFRLNQAVHLALRPRLPTHYTLIISLRPRLSLQRISLWLVGDDRALSLNKWLCRVCEM